MNFIDCTKFFGKDPEFEIGFGAYGDNDFHLMVDYGSGLADPVGRDFGAFSYESVAEIKVLWEEQDLLWDDETNYRQTVNKLEGMVAKLHILGEYVHAEFKLDEES